jgi:hypothetical protein
MVDQSNLGLDPGRASGSEIDGVFRIRFNRKLDDIGAAEDRLVDWIDKNT